jgi:glycosyltransferase involved in cell wall biosynthesis
MARHLREAGHRVTFVASDAFGSLLGDDERSVVRARDLKSARLLRLALGRGPLPTVGPGAAVERDPPGLLTKVLVPDAHVVSWLPAATLSLRRLVARGDVDCVVTTGPPDSAHLAPLALGTSRPAWLADFRDGWLFEPLREPFPTGAQRRLDAALERRVVQGADAVVAATAPIAADLRHRHGVDAATVTNGYDPALDADADAATLPPLPDDRALVAHTGTLSLSRKRDARPLFEALRLVGQEPGGSRLLLVHAGPTSSSDETLLAALRDDGLARTLGVVSRPAALALQRRASALLLVASGAVSQSTGKLFEYLAANRPILVLGSENEATRIVRETGTGVVVPPTDVDAIASALRDIATGAALRAYAPHGTERYVYPAPAEEMAVLVEEAIHRRAHARTRA